MLVKVAYLLLGFTFFSIGAVGVVLPILPTTPFLLLASYFFARSSERFSTWFENTKLYHKYLRTFIEQKTMKLSRKIVLTTFASSMLLFGFFQTNHLVVRIVILLVLVFLHYYFWFRIKTWKGDL